MALARKEAQRMGPRFISYSRSMIEHMPYTFNALERGELNEEQAMILVRETNQRRSGHPRIHRPGTSPASMGRWKAWAPSNSQSRVKKEVLWPSIAARDMNNHADAITNGA